MTLLFALAAHAAPVELHLIDPIARPGPRDECTISACRELLRLIEGAKTKIEFAVYGFRGQSDVVRAIEAAKARGVQIRGIVDMDEAGVNYYSDTAGLMERLGTIRTDYEADRRARQAKRTFSFAEKCERPKGFDGPLQCIGYDFGDRCLMAAHASEEEIDNAASIMHNKYFIIDNRWVWAGSTNVSSSGTGGYNANLVTVVDSSQVAAWYVEEFDQMYERDKYHNEKVSRGPYRANFAGTDISLDVLFSPQDKPITNAVRPLIQGATERIDVGIFFLTHKLIAKDLIDAHRRGVKVRVILDATAAKNGYTKHELLRAAGIPVKVETWGGKMHMKSAAIDGKTVITGSMNWTSAGEGGNDENTTVIHSPTIAKQYEVFFDKLWASIPDKWLQGRPDPESIDSAASCFDGTDNDFDHLKDSEDPGCSETPPALPPLPPQRFVAKADGEGVLVKGTQTKDGQPIYVWPTHPGYSAVKVSGPAQWFCTDWDAKDAGYKPAPKYWSPEDKPTGN